MADNRTCGCGNSNNNSAINNANTHSNCSQSSISSAKETVCIDTYRVLDSCRDKDCFENVRVFLTNYGQEIIEKAGNVRAKCAKVIWSYIDVDKVPFNKGFYQLTIKIYVKIMFEICVCPGNMQEIEGIAVVEKKAVLYGGEGSISIFKSDPNCSNFCSVPNFSTPPCTNMPIAVIETVDPIILSAKIVEPRHSCCCCCCCDEIPENVCGCLGGNLVDDDDCNKLLVSLGFFSVIRIQRPAQYLISAIEYSVPDKECIVAEDDDPCSLFRSMTFPTSEFSPPSIAECPRSELPRCGFGQ